MLLICFVFIPPFVVRGTLVNLHGFWITGAVLLAEAGLDAAVQPDGKFRHRDRMLKIANLRGDESVLDIGHRTRAAAGGRGEAAGDGARGGAGHLEGERPERQLARRGPRR